VPPTMGALGKAFQRHLYVIARSVDVEMSQVADSGAVSWQLLSVRSSSLISGFISFGLWQHRKPP